MKIEHAGYQVADPAATAAWYSQHLGFTIKRSGTDIARTHFLADETGQMLIEIYCNPQVGVPDYANMNPLTFHLAFSCDDIEGTAATLQSAGATIAEPLKVTDAGDRLLMMRDPWGMPIQLCKRAVSMV